MNKDTDALIESIKEDLIESKRLLAHCETLTMEGLRILSKL